MGGVWRVIDDAPCIRRVLVLWNVSYSRRMFPCGKYSFISCTPPNPYGRDLFYGLCVLKAISIYGPLREMHVPPEGFKILHKLYLFKAVARQCWWIYFMMKFLWKRNKEFTFIHSCWMFTQVCRNSVFSYIPVLTNVSLTIIQQACVGYEIVDSQCA